MHLIYKQFNPGRCIARRVGLKSVGFFDTLNNKLFDSFLFETQKMTKITKMREILRDIEDI